MRKSFVLSPVRTVPLPLFSATLIRAILKNPVYCGKIAFGRRKLEKIQV